MTCCPYCHIDRSQTTVKVLEFFAFPVAWLFGKLLDNVLGHRDDRESMFLYVPREALGLKGSGGLLGQMALVELHGEWAIRTLGAC